jgi:hypothetical protein
MTTMLRAAALAALLPSLVLGCKSDKKAPAGGGSAGSGAVAQPDQPETPKPGKPPAKAPDRGPERLAYSLVDNRLAAHVTRGGGLFIVGGSNGFAKYARFGNLRKTKNTAWKLRQSQGDVKVAVMTGGSAKLDVPVTEAQLAGEAVVRAALAEVGLDPALVERAGEPATKQALHDSTAAAIAGGVFGAPTSVVTVGAGGDRPVVFWGQDRLDLVDGRAARLGAGGSDDRRGDRHRGLRRPPWCLLVARRAPASDRPRPAPLEAPGVGRLRRAPAGQPGFAA